ncbi:MAG: hypothetical protein DRP83_02030 [Planctomycetota bacterium]|nr:MAG: hypothetical protein DRP83_02030 [Planctomycetota bacterium]
MMVDENEVTNENEAQESAEEQSGKDAPGEGDKKEKSSRLDTSSLLAWVLIALLVTAFSAGGGVAAAIISSGSATAVPLPQPGEQEAQDDIAGEAEAIGDARIGKDFVYYEFDPLTVNLDVVRQNRYIKVTVVLAIPKEDEADVITRLDDKKVELKDWIMTYMAGHTLEQVAGRKNMIRIQREISDTLNQKLWPNQRPRVNHVLFKDYAVQ